MSVYTGFTDISSPSSPLFTFFPELEKSVSEYVKENQATGENKGQSKLSHIPRISVN
jgi:hypothetical protein